ncbi:Rieske [2Fe-2S] domain protein [compost metagenome]
MQQVWIGRWFPFFSARDSVCLHRGRRLTANCGHAANFHCNYHSWQRNLDGSIARVLDRIPTA